MAAPDWYGEWRHVAVHELQDKNRRVAERFRIDDWPRWDYDLDDGTLTFSEDGVVKVIARIQVVGTTSVNAGNWLWGWGNSHWPHDSIADVEKVRAFGVEHGISELTDDYVEESPDDLNFLGWELTAAAVRVCGAIGAYRPQREEGGSLYLMYRSIDWAPSPDFE